MYHEIRQRPTRSVATSSDCSSIAFIISCLVGITTTLAVASKIATKFWMKREFGTDDTTILIALLLSLGMVVSVCWATDTGLGKSQSMLDHVQLALTAKLVYTTDLLYIASLFFSKTSMLVIVKFLTPFGGAVKTIWLMFAVLVGWTVSALVVVAFECSMPQVWNTMNGNCLNLQVFWTYYDVLNMLLEIGASTIPIVVIRRVQIASARKRIIIAVFLFRFLVLVPIIAGLVFRQRTAQLRDDPPFAQWPIAVCMQVVQCFSIVFACVPFLKPFFASLETGMVRLDDTRRLAARTATSTGGYGGSECTPEVSSMAHQRNNYSWTNASSGRKVSVEHLPSISVDTLATEPNRIYTTTTFSVVGEGSSGMTTKQDKLSQLL